MRPVWASQLQGPGVQLTGRAVQLLMNIPFTALYFATYESSKKILGQTDEDEGLLVQVISGLPAEQLLISTRALGC